MASYFSDEQLEGIARQASSGNGPCIRFASDTWSDLSKRQKFLVDLSVISSIHTDITISRWTKGLGRTRKIEKWVEDSSSEIFVFYLTNFIISFSLQGLFTDSFASQLRLRTKLAEEDMLAITSTTGYSVIDYAMEQYELFGKTWCKSLAAAGLRGDCIPSLDLMLHWPTGIQNTAVVGLISDFAQTGHLGLRAVLKFHCLDSQVKGIGKFLQGHDDDGVVESSAAEKRRLYLEERKRRK